MVNDSEQVVLKIERILQWRRNRCDAWARENFHGEDPAKISTELDAEAFQRIRNLFR